MPLTDIRIRNAKPREKVYKLFDGGGLFILVKPNGSKLWRLAYRYGGKQIVMALGSYPAVPIAGRFETVGGHKERILGARELAAQLLPNLINPVGFTAVCSSTQRESVLMLAVLPTRSSPTCLV